MQVEETGGGDLSQIRLSDDREAGGIFPPERNGNWCRYQPASADYTKKGHKDDQAAVRVVGRTTVCARI